MKQVILCVWIILGVIGWTNGEAVVQDNKELAKFFRLKAQSYIPIFRYREAEIYFEKALKVAPGEVKNYIEFSAFLLGQNKSVQSIETLKKGLEIVTGDTNRAPLLYNLGSLYWKDSRFQESEQVYTEALGIFRKLAEAKPADYLPNLASTLNNLGVLYCQTTRYSQACPVLHEALKIYEKLAQLNPASFDLQFCQTVITLVLLDKHAPGACTLIENISALKDQAIAILKKYPDNPQAQEMLKTIEELK